MKKLIMILFAVATGTANINAQEPVQPPPPKKTPEQRAEMVTKNMTKNLDLKPEQQEKIKAIIIKREKEREALKENMKGRHEVMEKQLEEDFQKILSPEQFEKFKKRREEMKKKRMEKGMTPVPEGEMPPPPPGEEK
jgi:Spy/CpxP family protein refolding chaperone